ncbi:SDR family NAD(P)-dependent oxidoreductase [Chryseolinea lacunae]|uniref:SDR family oxidoreductase n=1 Tax=Chryseolinea lacunae TaxID=2801331 RepID=A0ABS1KKI4_9BACT|nr:SDR family oxidoreductase [Chryseolinea lacunae]MBL0739968.1 SDR family oxidoreductase [Chryseolinea lacunae]
MEQKTFLFAGACSAIATQTATILQRDGHTVIGLSTKPDNGLYSSFHTVTHYDRDNFPLLEGPLNGLVYFPGTINLKSFSRLSPGDFLQDFQVNALGAALFTQHYLSNLKRTDDPSIVFVSSVAASVGLPFHASIAMAKAAVEGLTKALAAELAPAVRVNCVAPSMVNTPLAAKFLDSLEKREQVAKRNPLRKIGQPEDVATVIKFLLQDESSWMTGQIVGVDGGMNFIRN